MQVHFIQFLIVCPLVFLAGFIDAIAGGGGLISLPAYLISGIPIHMAIGTNKLSSGLGTGLTTYRFARKGYISYKIAFFAVITAFFGAVLRCKIVPYYRRTVFDEIDADHFAVDSMVCGKRDFF